MSSHGTSSFDAAIPSRPSYQDPSLSTPARIRGDEGLSIDRLGTSRQIWGADMSLPIFDGRSTNYADHLIDLDTPSMETVLDVRLYFWQVGVSLQEDPEQSLHVTFEQAKIYDDAVVRAGRLHLKDCRARGHGYYLNVSRHLAWFNQYGNPWYRMPTFGVVNDLIEGRLLGEPGEGFLEDVRDYHNEQSEMEIDGLMLTNIRMPVLWAEFESPSFRRGSADYNCVILDMYGDKNPLTRLLWQYGRDGVMDEFFFGSEYFTDRAGLEAFIERQWPSEPADNFEPRDMLKETHGSARAFVLKTQERIHATAPLNDPFRNGILAIDRTGRTRQITGADLSKPVFDGTSLNMVDHLIDLDTPAMETDLDVRLYFWMIGDNLEEHDDPLTHSMDEAREYDDKVVRAGRLYLKACRGRGHGYYLSPGRNLAWFNQPGNPWYRMPAFGIVNDLIDGRLLPEQGEGFFQDLWGEGYQARRDMEAECFMLTNIRMPVVWADFESHEFSRGSADWNYVIMGKYTTLNPLGRLMFEYGREGAIDRLFLYSEYYTDSAGRDAFIDHVWPNQRSDSPEVEPVDLLKVTHGTAKEFVTGKRPLKKRMRDIAKSFGQRS